MASTRKAGRRPNAKRGGRTKAPTTRRVPRGRPTSLTDETIAVLEKHIRAGVSYRDAALGAGVDPTTFDRWRDRGRADAAANRETDYSAFYRRLELANFALKSGLVESVIKAAKRDARIALKVLERRFPDEWGLTIKIEDTTAGLPQSPRERFLRRLAEIEDRHQRAEAAVRHVLQTDAKEIGAGASGGPVLPPTTDE